MGFQGHPLRCFTIKKIIEVLLTYGYRIEPYGSRRSFFNAECTDYLQQPPDSSRPFSIRDDGGNDVILVILGQPKSDKVLVIHVYHIMIMHPFIAGPLF